MIQKEYLGNQTQEEWQAFRTSLKTVGGSDAGTILGLNKYSSAYSIWAQKTGKVPVPNLSDKEAVRLGNDLEDYVARRWMEETGKKVQRSNYVYRNTEYPFAHANLDRVVVGENAGLECKTTSSWDIVAQCRDGSFPDAWYAQMMHYMMVTGADKWYLGVLCFGHGFYCFDVYRSDADIDALAAAEEEFYRMVCDDTPPALDGTEATHGALTTILGDSVQHVTADLTAVSGNLTVYNDLCSRIKELQLAADEQKAVIMQFMGAAENGSFGRYSVSFKTQERRSFDRAAFERDRGKIPEQYFKVSTSRPFRFNFKKEDF